MIERTKLQQCPAAASQTNNSCSGPSSDDASSPRSVLGKMILPRLDTPIYDFSAIPKRTPHACERCRALKAKCTGGTRCEKCVLDKAECKYGDGKRERNKKYESILFILTWLLRPQKGDGLSVAKEHVSDHSKCTAARGIEGSCGGPRFQC